MHLSGSYDLLIVDHLIRGVFIICLKRKLQDTILNVLHWSPGLELNFLDAPDTMELDQFHEFLPTYPLNSQ